MGWYLFDCRPYACQMGGHGLCYPLMNRLSLQESWKLVILFCYYIVGWEVKEYNYQSFQHTVRPFTSKVTKWLLVEKKKHLERENVW